MLTPRTGYAVVAGSVWLLLAALFLPLAWANAIWWLALVTAVAMDARAVGAARRVTARRKLDPILSLGAANRVELVLRNRSDQTFQCQVRDAPPLDFHAGSLRLQCELPADGDCRPTYSLTPRRRGDYEFGRLEARLTSRLGLVARQLRFELNEHVRVYPNLADIRAYQMHASKQLLPDIGVHPVRLLSMGLEFESLRAYVPGDEPRRIDWKATARHGEPITREYDIEKSQHVVICLDLGRVMMSELGALTKADHAVNAAALLTHVASRHGDWVGLFAFAEQPMLFVPPRKNQFQRVLEALYGLQPERVESDYQRSFLEAAAHIRKRALVVLLTDLVDPDSSARLRTHIGLLTRKHVVLCAALSDYELYDIARRAPETPRDLYERTVATALLADRQKAVAALRERGAMAFDATPENLSVAVLNHYLEIKARARL
jgi:uncharacterized protein (DUF58 family)